MEAPSVRQGCGDSQMKKVSGKQARELALRRKVKLELIGKFGNRCMICGKSPDFKDGRGELHLSHTISLAQGGKTTEGNCQLLCRICHNKHHRILEV